MTGPQPLHVFRAGTHTASCGNAFTITPDDVERMVAAYDPVLHRAPFVVGHPRHDTPAYGWAAAFSSPDGQNVFAVPGRVDPQFVEWVRSGNLAAISMSFYRPEAAGNPSPGAWYPRHVGFLGAQPPAVKGLQPPEFGDGGEGVAEVTIDLAELGEAAAYRPGLFARLFRGLRDWIIEEKGVDAADRVVPAYYLEELEAAPEAPSEPAPTPAFSTPPSAMAELAATTAHHPNSVDLAEREQALLSRQAQLDEREQALLRQEAERAAEARAAEAAAFVEGLVADGARVLPADASLVASTLAQLEAGEPVAFGEGEDAPTLAAAFREWLARAPRQVDFSERSAPRGAGDTELDTSDPRALAQAAVELQEAERVAGRQISAAEAVQRVKRARG